MTSQDADHRQGIALGPEQVAMIEEALAGVGDFGEVNFIVHKGRMPYLVMQGSYDALRWELITVPPYGGPEARLPRFSDPRSSTLSSWRDTLWRGRVSMGRQQ
jgi:hypothetical protein